MEVWKNALEIYDQAKTGDKEEETVHELNLTKTSHMQVEREEIAENEFFTSSEMHLRIY